MLGLCFKLRLYVSSLGSGFRFKILGLDLRLGEPGPWIWGNPRAAVGGTRLGNPQPLVFKTLYKIPISKPS